MTEDDTYKALMKPTFIEMQALWRAASNTDGYTLDATIHFFHKHGWTYSDYANEYKARYLYE